MPYTQSDLATRVLRDLGLYGPDEDPSDDDIQDTIQIISSEVAAMAVRGIPIWSGSDVSVPTEYLNALSQRLGLAVGPSYGVFTMIEAMTAIPVAEQYMRQMSSTAPTYEPLQGQSF